MLSYSFGDEVVLSNLVQAYHWVGHLFQPYVQGAIDLAQSSVHWGLSSQDRTLEDGEIALIVLIILLILLCPRWLRKILRGAEGPVLRLYARRRITTIVLIGLIPAAVRLAVLPVISMPIPFIADEFSHLLLADTIAAGRLSNPPHEMARHFEASYVLQRPSYSSVYPPGHGIVMGLAELCGLHPWYGVLAEVTVMIIAIVWMLDAWVPPRWVLLGALIATVRLGVWMTSYWGGALAAAAGALVVGSVKRIADGGSMRHGFTLGLGLILLANTRPFEGFLLGIAAMASLVVMLKGPIPRIVLAPLAATLLVGAAAMSYYHWRVTGNPLLMPYAWDQQESGVPQSFIVQPPVPPPAKLAHYKDLQDNYSWQLAVYQEASRPSSFWQQIGKKLTAFWHFFLHPLFVPPLLMLPWVALRDRHSRILLAAGLFVMLGTFLYAFYFPHYSAPLAGILIVLLVQGYRRLSLLARRTRGGGLMLAPAMELALTGIVLCLLGFALVSHKAIRERLPTMYPAGSLARFEIDEKLSHSAGRHLVLVRYAPNHIFHWGMTYNHANIDESPVVWARELDSESNTSLLQYYRGRVVWLYEPDLNPPRLSPYPSTTLAINR